MPSSTAREAAAHRLLLSRPTTRYGDLSADLRLQDDVADGLVVDRESPRGRLLRGRTAAVDTVVVRGLERGVTQVVSVGAGYDGRALRLAREGVRWWEVDHPETLGDKRARLSRLGIDATDVTFVESDLREDHVADLLVSAGLDPDRPALLVAEGVLADLERTTALRLLGGLRSLATAGTRLALLDADGAVGDLLAPTGWRAVDLGERARRVGLVVAAPVWAPVDPPTRSVTGRHLERLRHRDGLGDLADHLEDEYGVRVTRTRRLDVGVVRADLATGGSWVARVAPRDVPSARVRGEARALTVLAAFGLPVEVPAAEPAVTRLHEQPVLVTAFVPGGRCRPTTATYGALGDLLGRLHLVGADPRAAGLPDGAGGAWHHLLPDGAPRDEVAAVRRLVAGRPTLTDTVGEELDELAEALGVLDDLPHAFTHPDPAPVNLVADPSGPVLVDWAGAGVAARVWSLGFLLWAAHRPGPVGAAVGAYLARVDLTPDEWEALPLVVGARPAVFEAWGLATGRRPAADAGRARAERLAGVARVVALAQAARRAV